MEDRPCIKTEEEFDKIPNNICYHYHPETYLKKYNFTENILIDLFCSQRIPSSFEDYYYDDLSISMIEEYQPHINTENLLDKWFELDIIREIESFCILIIKLLKRKLSFHHICSFQLDLIEDYIEKYHFMEEYKNQDYFETLFEDFQNIMKTNKYSIKYDLYKEEEWNNKNKDWLINKAEELQKNIPNNYSSLLPL